MAKAAKVDFSQVLLQHGERIGLGVAGILAAVLVLTGLFMPGRGIFSGSPEEKAKALQGPTASVEQQLRTATPTESDLPPKVTEDKIVALETDFLDPNKFGLPALVPPLGTGVLGRGVPKVFSVEEAVARFNHVQIQTYVFTNDDPPRLIALSGGGSGAAGGATGTPSTGSAGASMMRMFGRGGGSGLGSMLSPPGGGSGALAMPGMAPTEGDSGGKKDRKIVTIKLTELEKRLGSVTLAEQIRPLRLVVIGASFPYKKQIEEFQKKLGLRSVGEVLGENAIEVGPDGQVLPSFRFLGVQVQRRELDGDGNPIKGKDFEDLNLIRDYRPYLVLTAQRYEPDDPELSQVMFPGLVMPRLKQFRESDIGTGFGGAGTGEMMTPGGGIPPGMASTPMEGEGVKPAKRDPKKDQYPAVAKELPLISKTLKDLASRNAPEAPTAPRPFQAVGDDFNIFSPRPTTGVNETGMGPAGMGYPRPGMRPPGGMGPMPGGMGEAGSFDPNLQLEPPEYCLVRLIDVTAQPGKTYEYRLRIRMANPNHERRDVASPIYAKEKELVSEWSKMPIKVTIPHELHYYAVDQKEIEKAENPREPYKGIYITDNLRKDRKMILQIHRWLDTVKINNKTPLMVADWAVAERVPIYVGEYVGRRERVELPVWRYSRESFVIASDGSTSKFRKGIEVPLGFQAPGPQPESILVDFRQGDIAYDRVVRRTEENVETKLVRDEAGSQALILNPDGRLILVEGALDVEDKDRTERLNKVRKRIREVEEASKAKPATGMDEGGTNPFGSP